MSSIAQPNDDQLRAMERYENLNQKARTVKKSFEDNPTHDFFFQKVMLGEKFDEASFGVSKGLTQAFSEAGLRSLSRDLSDSGLDDYGWAWEWKKLMEGKVAPPPKIENPAIDQEGHAMLPVFKQTKGSDSVRSVLFFRCTLCKPMRISYPKPL